MNEEIFVTPRNYKLNFRKVNDLDTHYAIIGIAAGIADYPLYLSHSLVAYRVGVYVVAYPPDA
ncbi:hypothetical protein EfmGK923_08980 [Enterococcus faecium]|nr:hypothetical protein EfmGK923_08980 [Enterococcus faecium]